MSEFSFDTGLFLNGLPVVLNMTMLEHILTDLLVIDNTPRLLIIPPGNPVATVNESILNFKIQFHTVIFTIHLKLRIHNYLFAIIQLHSVIFTIYLKVRIHNYLFATYLYLCSICNWNI